MEYSKDNSFDLVKKNKEYELKEMKSELNMLYGMTLFVGSMGTLNSFMIDDPYSSAGSLVASSVASFILGTAAGKGKGKIYEKEKELNDLKS